MENIYVTKPFLPPFEEFESIFRNIWQSRILTNNGKYHQQLEEELCRFLDVPYISLFSNGTLALITALQALDISGEVITTPFSFVATTHALKWNNITPVFADISQDTFNLNPEEAEKKITKKTSAILPVHVYGIPCDVVGFSKLSEKYGIKILYDACHTFDVRIGNVPVLNFGDLSVMSFHATKVYNTFEGGAIVCHNSEMKQHIDDLKNFGFRNETTVVAAGINAKMNEFQAAVGLVQLRYVKQIIKKRRDLTFRYIDKLSDKPGLSFYSKDENIQYCYPYFPVTVDPASYGCSRDDVYMLLRTDNIFARRYFYPLISQFPVYRHLESSKSVNLPVAEKIAENVLCLPLYPDLTFEQQDQIIKILKKN